MLLMTKLPCLQWLTLVRDLKQYWYKLHNHQQKISRSYPAQHCQQISYPSDLWIVIVPHFIGLHQTHPKGNLRSIVEGILPFVITRLSVHHPHAKPIYSLKGIAARCSPTSY
ncbi:hypothetical protein TNCT_533911 [Trichonephila clavata]|uniref:Uncharacterized protein n=1 Tax=Trichonephila clavata TaxID=2740835 RepID=A0A8X6L295_TRICU|nr:hypothetical protein TNCT_533911 [Trichonephila clavata]